MSGGAGRDLTLRSEPELSGKPRRRAAAAGALDSPWAFSVLLASLFLFRLAFGLSLSFWSPDELQIYLLGLKFYSTHLWPFFGPDVYPGVRPVVQIPGALQGLLVGGPFFVLPIPEAPYLLLNALSFAALCLLAWYCSKRLPQLPRFAVWTWTCTAPWVLEFSTHVVNPSYVLFGSILFFVGMMETTTPLRRDLLAVSVAAFFMGFGLAWVMQLHLSWVILLPYVAVSAGYQTAAGVRRMARFASFFLLGACLPACLLVPTLWRYGFSSGLGGTEHALGFNAKNLDTLLTILVRYLSFANFQLYDFFDTTIMGWVPVLKSSPWLIPVVAFPVAIGALQPVLLVVLWFKKSHTERDWQGIKILAALTLLLIYVAFLFSMKRPKAHTFYVVFPVIFVYSLYCWNTFGRWRRWKVFLAAFLVTEILSQGAYALHGGIERGLYRARTLPEAAIEARDYRLLAERREGARY
jgi:hypothetical protein